jgi:hypothetical protein
VIETLDGERGLPLLFARGGMVGRGRIKRTCVRFLGVLLGSPISAGWLLCLMPAIPRPYWKWVVFKLALATSA